jgi:hypothetical protein
VADLGKWVNFYPVTGGAAGALIGLQFVVLTLIAQRPRPRLAEAGSAFISPTIVHFCIILFLSALLLAPWTSLRVPAVLCGLTGLGGAAYVSLSRSE